MNPIIKSQTWSRICLKYQEIYKEKIKDWIAAKQYCMYCAEKNELKLQESIVESNGESFYKLGGFIECKECSQRYPIEYAMPITHQDTMDLIRGGFFY
jgi:hypothetical protein